MLIALIAAGCGTTQRVSLPDWEGAAREPTEIADPIELPQLCAIPWASTSTECWSRLDDYDVVATGNTAIAEGNTAALRKAEAAYDRLIAAGTMQQELAEIRQELLEEERRQRELDKWWYRAIILGGVIAVGVTQ